jgi:DnaJ-class molecular chaperone
VPNFYEVLGVAQQASDADIKKAYVRLARERHPDRFTDPGEREAADRFFKDLTSAFNTLSNPSSRREYDESLKQPERKAPEQLAEDAYARGLDLYEQRQYHDAIESFRVAVHHVPDNAAYHFGLGRSLAKNPNWMHDAVGELEQSIRLAPKRAEYHAELAALFMGQGLKLRARRCLEAALKVAPGDARIQKLAAQVGVGGGEDDTSRPPSGGLRGLLRRKP